MIDCFNGLSNGRVVATTMMLGKRLIAQGFQWPLKRPSSCNRNSGTFTLLASGFNGLSNGRVVATYRHRSSSGLTRRFNGLSNGRVVATMEHRFGVLLPLGFNGLSNGRVVATLCRPSR